MTGAGPRPSRSAALRLSLLVAGVVIGIALVAMAAQYRATAQALARADAARLAADMAGLGVLYDQRRVVALTSALDLRAATTPVAAEMFLLADRAGAVLAGNVAEWPAELPALAGADFGVADARAFEAGGVRYLGVARVLPGGFPLFLAHSVAGSEATLAALRRSIALVAAALVAVAAGAGWLVGRAATARVARLNALANRVAAGDLAARLPGPRTPDEWGDLETHIHGMLDRIEVLDRARSRLSDTVAHELRTPLNRLRQKLARIEGQEPLVAELEQELRGTIRIFDALLDISAAEARTGARPGLVPVDLSALAEEVFDLYEALAEDRGLTARARVTPGLWVLGDRNLIAQAVSNLLDNAVKFTPSGGSVTLALEPAADRHALTIADTGPGLPEEMRDGAFQPFRRGARDRDIPGHGLGLALVQAIAARHGARVDTPGAEKGFVVRLLWPKVAAALPDPDRIP